MTQWVSFSCSDRLVDSQLSNEWYCMSVCTHTCGRECSSFIEVSNCRGFIPGSWLIHLHTSIPTTQYYLILRDTEQTPNWFTCTHSLCPLHSSHLPPTLPSSQVKLCRVNHLGQLTILWHVSKSLPGCQNWNRNVGFCCCCCCLYPFKYC